MLTKEEILKQHFSNNSGTPWSEIHAAMEEYAKQEVKEFINDGRYYKYSETKLDEFWNEYQKSKLKK